MTGPVGGSGDDAADARAAGGQHPQQPGWAAPWDAPPPAGPAPGYPGGEHPGYLGEYPPFTPPFGYQQPPGPAEPPPQLGGPPTGWQRVDGPPPYPGGYYPAPGYPGDYWPADGAAVGTNGLAIASLIASFTGLLCGIGGIVGIVLGTIALDQIKRTRQDGYGMAVAGIVIGVATLIVGLIVMIFAVHSH
ncbi:DUF4190 domain-containing protein [Mycobacterium sherrisii]|uniref:DUF4190 domain-containing protein n=1 Tax=Mycobacterium sherrisii TaxID=243061 RepID=UPI000A161FAD|nr:DUF4190 domain-containing protein [Mycobacterium sherrisii]MCV7030556.1 DUF4190 domain-containing protein [Mycobacterium sherrisii]